MKRNWKGKAVISNKIYVKIMLILLVAFTIYGAIVTVVVYRNVLKENYNNIEGMLDSGAENIGRTFEMMEGTTIALSGSDSISKWRNNKGYFSSNDKKSSLHTESLNKEMQRVLIYNNVWNFDLFDYLTVYENEKLLAYTYTKSYSTQQIIDRTKNIFYTAKKDESFKKLIPPTREDKTIYTILKVKTDFSSADAMYIIGGTSVEGLNDKLSTMATFEGAKAYLIQNNGRVFASNCNEDLGNILTKKIMDAKGQHSQIKFAGNSYDILRKRVNNDFQILYMFPKQAIMRQTLLGMESLIVLSIVIAILMVVALTLMESSYETRLLNDEAEIKFLQQQMNPHFLFNILLTIQIKAKMSGDESIYKMIASLSSLLRAGIYGDKRSIVSIEEELKYVEYYLSLQKERYEDKLNYSITVEDKALYKCEIPRLSVEPIVENAVIHGVETVDRPALVQVNVTEENGQLVIHVIDNGVGFDVETLDLEGISMDENGMTREKVGLKSTLKRIQLIYGKKYGLDVVSYKNIGTDIAVRVPKREWVCTNG